jgi:hypothetical protein
MPHAREGEKVIRLKRQPKKRMEAGQLGYLLLGFFLYIAGMLLRGGPANPDVVMSGGQVLGVYLTFGGFFLAVIGYGLAVAERLGFRDGSLWKVMALGTASSSLMAMLLGHARLISYDLAPLAALWLLAGIYLGSSRWRILLPERPCPGLSWVPAAACALYLADWMAKAGYAGAGSTDPFFYHLLGPRQWTDEGWIHFRPGYSSTIHASYWEHLFIWINMLLGDHEGRGLIEGHLFAQMVHVGLGAVTTCAAVYALVAAHAAWRGWAWLAAFAALNSQSLAIYGWLAKNDYGLLGWSLAGLLLLFGPGARVARARRVEVVAGGLLLGMAIMGKVVYSFALAPLLAAWALREHLSGRRRLVLPVAVAVAAPIIAMVVRNYAFTGDPLYPLLTIKLRLDTHWLGPSHFEGLPVLLGGTSDSLAYSARVVWMLVTDVPWLGALSLLAIPLAYARPNLKVPALLVSACLAGYALFASHRFGEAYYRWLGPGLLVQTAVGAIVLAELATWLGGRRRWVTAASVALVAAMLVLLRMPEALGPGSWSGLVAGPSATYVIRSPAIHPGGDALAWLRLNMQPGDRALTTGYQMLYYVSHLKVAAMANEPSIDETASRLTDPVLMTRRLREFGVRYVLDVRKWDARYFWRSGSTFDRIASLYPEAIAYEGPDSFIVDLRKLAPEVEGACLKPGSGREFEW